MLGDGELRGHLTVCHALRCWGNDLLLAAGEGGRSVVGPAMVLRPPPCHTTWDASGWGTYCGQRAELPNLRAALCA
jgi:hypothetical protein